MRWSAEEVSWTLIPSLVLRALVNGIFLSLRREETLSHFSFSRRKRGGGGLSFLAVTETAGVGETGVAGRAAAGGVAVFAGGQTKPSLKKKTSSSSYLLGRGCNPPSPRRRTQRTRSGRGLRDRSPCRRRQEMGARGTNPESPESRGLGPMFLAPDRRRTRRFRGPWGPEGREREVGRAYISAQQRAARPKGPPGRGSGPARKRLSVGPEGNPY